MQSAISLAAAASASAVDGVEVARFPKKGIVNPDSSGIEPPILVARFPQNRNCEPRFLRNRSTSRMVDDPFIIDGHTFAVRCMRRVRSSL